MVAKLLSVITHDCSEGLNVMKKQMTKGQICQSA